MFRDTLHKNKKSFIAHSWNSEIVFKKYHFEVMLIIVQLTKQFHDEKKAEIEVLL